MLRAGTTLSLAACWCSRRRRSAQGRWRHQSDPRRASSEAGAFHRVGRSRTHLLSRGHATAAVADDLPVRQSADGGEGTYSTCHSDYRVCGFVAAQGAELGRSMANTRWRTLTPSEQTEVAVAEH